MISDSKKLIKLINYGLCGLNIIEEKSLFAFKAIIKIISVISIDISNTTLQNLQLPARGQYFVISWLIAYITDSWEYILHIFVCVFGCGLKTTTTPRHRVSQLRGFDPGTHLK